MHAVTTTRRPVSLTIIVHLGIFGIAMGLLEAIVVVYLRQIYYPGGFNFPLKAMPSDSIAIEIIREISTIAMLISVSAIAGRSRIERFACFLFTFGVWDIFYYVWLKALLDWPPSLHTWDILFLIPVIWAAPVLAPIICAFTMIVFGILILLALRRGSEVTLTRGEWFCLFGGAFITFVSFIETYTLLALERHLPIGLSNLASDGRTHEIVERFVPSSFNWILFGAGEMLIVCALLSFAWRNRAPRAI